MNPALAGNEMAATANATVATTERRKRRTPTGTRTFVISSLPSDYSDIAARTSLNRDLAGPVRCDRPRTAATHAVDVFGRRTRRQSRLFLSRATADPVV